jgi:hypothetical protein
LGRNQAQLGPTQYSRRLIPKYRQVIATLPVTSSTCRSTASRRRT